MELPLPRRLHDPMTALPRPRQSLRDEHHLFWPRLYLRALGLTPFRTLKCARAAGIDSMVHSLVHQRFSGILMLTHETHVDFRERATECRDRHQAQACACVRSDRLEVIDALSLDALRDDQPPCLGLSVDTSIASLMRAYYETTAPITSALRDVLRRRCQQGLCGCQPTQSQHVA